MSWTGRCTDSWSAKVLSNSPVPSIPGSRTITVFSSVPIGALVACPGRTSSAHGHRPWTPTAITCRLLRPRSTRHDLLVQFLIDGLDRAVDFGAGCAELMGDQLHQKIDPLDEGRATGHRPRGRRRLEQAFRRLGVFRERNLIRRIGAETPGD